MQTEGDPEALCSQSVKENSKFILLYNSISERPEKQDIWLKNQSDHGEASCCLMEATWERHWFLNWICGKEDGKEKHWSREEVLYSGVLMGICVYLWSEGTSLHFNMPIL